ncbi:MAG TPA: zinc metallopeptidase [Gammaproteobacteria bacterium]|nr:zinc metallopeptidase [Gammaproteobacteria bacterium]
MSILLATLLLLIILFGPQLWVQAVFRRHAEPRPELAGNGGEFARHLLNQLHMADVGVESADGGDHYDPVSKTVRLNKDRLEGKSLTAIVVAAHEVGHALQDRLGYQPLRWRSQLVFLAQAAQKLGNIMFILAPVVAGLARAPSVAVIMLLAVVVSFGSAALLHLITLPVEWDASFRRALPLLEAGHYLSEEDQAAARQILTAAAFTYVAASLASLLNLWRWLRWVKR